MKKCYKIGNITRLNGITEYIICNQNIKPYLLSKFNKIYPDHNYKYATFFMVDYDWIYSLFSPTHKTLNIRVKSIRNVIKAFYGRRGNVSELFEYEMMNYGWDNLWDIAIDYFLIEINKKYPYRNFIFQSLSRYNTKGAMCGKLTLVSVVDIPTYINVHFSDLDGFYKYIREEKIKELLK